MGTLLLMRKSDWFDRGERKNFAAASSTAAATTFAATRSIAAATAFHHSGRRGNFDLRRG